MGATAHQPEDDPEHQQEDGRPFPTLESPFQPAQTPVPALELNPEQAEVRAAAAQELVALVATTRGAQVRGAALFAFQPQVGAAGLADLGCALVEHAALRAVDGHVPLRPGRLCDVLLVTHP